MKFVDEKLIQLSETVKLLTTDSTISKKLHDDYAYYSKINGLTYTNCKTKHYQVDAKQFYDWVKQKFPDLKDNIPIEYRLTSYQGSFNAQYALNTYASAPKFSTLDEAKQIIQDQADEIRDLNDRLKDLIDKHNQVVAKLKIKADKWDNWNNKKGRRAK